MKSIRYLLLALIVALASAAWAPVALPSRPGLKYPIGNTVVSIDVTAETVTLQWSKSSVPLGATLQGYDWEISEYATVDTSGTFGSNPNYGKFVFPLTASGTGVAPSVFGDPLYPTESVVIPANTFDYGKKYYWHVRAEDDTASQYSYWSTTGVFRVGTQFPALGALTNNDTLRPTFNWSPNVETVATSGYAFELSLYPDFSAKAISATIPATALTKYTPALDLLPNRTYYWRVRALNSTLGNSKWSQSSFTSAIPPTRPVLKAPANGVLQMDLTPTFKWQPSVSQGDGVDHYELQISANAAFDPLLAPVLKWDDASPTPVPTAPDPTSGWVEYTLPNADELDPAITYYWRVLAYSTGGDYSFSTSVFKFTTGIVGQVQSNTMDPGPTYGNVPGLEGPAGGPSKSILNGYGVELATGDNINLLTLRPTFRWEWDELSLGNVSSFVLQIASAQSGGCNLNDPNNGFKPFISVNVKANSVGVPSNKEEYTPVANLPANQNLCWRLQPYHPVYAPAGQGLWSQVQVFKTPNPPSAPTLLFPRNGALTNDSSPRLVWSKVDLNGEAFGKYEIEISRFSDFKGYTYSNSVPPYVVTPITYPLPDPSVPMDPTDPVTEPIVPLVMSRTIPDYTNFPLYPQIIHAHETDPGSPDYETVNDLNEPWFQMHEDFDTVLPIDYGPLYGAETYYWRVRAYNANGEYSNWSAPFTLKISPDRPENVTVTFPNPTTLRPTVTWDPVILADSAAPAKYYKIYFYVTKGTPSLLDDAMVFSPAGFVQGTSYIPTVDLPKNAEMYAKVFAWDLTYGYSLYGASANFTTPAPPLPPSGLIAPATGSLVQSVRPPAAQDYKPTFYWKLPAPDMTPQGQTFDDYQIQISENDPTFSAATIIQASAASELSNSYQLTPADLALTPLRTYYWRVRTCSSDGGVDACSAWTPAFMFKTAIKAPEGLAEDLLTDPLRPILSWTAVPGAAKYLVYVKPGSTSCTGNVTPAAVAINSYQFPRNLASGDYSWCVVAYDAFKFGSSVLSEMRTFAIP